ncbi:MAG: putative RecB family exonuclease [Chthoniobacter sp.]|jgi:putative RecB family exonuclease|nr:putative RecB family exonuclease [Chthoniobacter sp.]
MIATVAPVPIIPAAPVSPPAPRGGRSRNELLATVSASRLGTWLGCRLKFYFRYVLGITKPTTPARHIGSVVHAVLQQWNLARWRRAPLVGDLVPAVFNKAWTDAQEGHEISWDEDESEEAVKATALGLVATYLRDTPIPADERPEAVEVLVEMDLAAQGLPMLVGIIDLVRAGGRIVDFKTTGKTPNAGLTLHTNEVQLTAYSLLYRDATGRREAAVELHHLVKLKTPKIAVVESGPATEAQTTRFFRLVESYVRGVETEDYVPAPGFQCACCEFLNECRAWR